MRSAALVLLAAAAFAGCASASHRRLPSGAGVFAADCSQCHSLIGNDSLRRQGGDLIGYRFSRQQLLSFTREMPVPHPLSSAQLAAVVDYVLAVQGGASRS